MTFCKVCGKLLPNVRFDPTEIAICQNCADRMEEDVVRVVRCRDCKHGYILTGSAFVTCGRRFHDGQKHESDWYCADGEK